MKRQNMKDEEAVHKLLVEINEDKMHQVEKNNKKVAKQEKGEVEKGSQTQWMRVIRQAWDGYEADKKRMRNQTQATVERKQGIATIMGMQEASQQRRKRHLELYTWRSFTLG